MVWNDPKFMITAIQYEGIGAEYDARKAAILDKLWPLIREYLFSQYGYSVSDPPLYPFPCPVIVVDGDAKELYRNEDFVDCVNWVLEKITRRKEDILPPPPPLGGDPDCTLLEFYGIDKLWRFIKRLWRFSGRPSH